MRLTLTWDVLKRKIHTGLPANIVINFNMGCIETYGVMLFYDVVSQINFNMRCIETLFETPVQMRHTRLTLT